MKSLQAYRVSKAVYVVALSISVIVDASLAISLYDWLRIVLGEGLSRIVLLAGAVGLGGCLYYLYMAQMEYLTRHK